MTKEVRNTRVYVGFCLFVLTAVMITANVLKRDDNETNTQRDKGRIEGREDARQEGTGLDRELGRPTKGDEATEQEPNSNLGKEREHSTGVPNKFEPRMPNRLLPSLEQQDKLMQARVPC